MAKTAPSMLVFSASLGVLASVLYHIVQMLTLQDVNPVVTLVVNVAATLVLIPIGLVFFGENLALANLIGLVLSLLGLVLVNLKP